jgi:hypothetical protein
MSRTVFAASLFGAGLLGSVSATAQNLYETMVSVPVTLIPQQTDSWCWAASGQMVMAYFGVNELQCYQAFVQFGQNKRCCNYPTPLGCVQGGQVIIDYFGFTYQQLGASSSLTRGQIEAQIFTQAEPWIINPNNGTTFGHVMVGVSYIDLSNIVPNFLLVGINDPWPPNVGDFYYETYDAYSSGVWQGVAYGEGFDLYDIAPPPRALSEARVIVSRPQPPPTIASELATQVTLGDATPETAAAEALRLFKGLMTDDRARNLGFSSAASVSSAVLAAPVQEYGISLERIRGWASNRSTEGLLVPEPALLVPVQVGGTTRASLRLRQENGLWRLASFGHAGLSRAWQSARPAPGQFLVEINALEVAFVGRRDGNQVYLKPIVADARLGLTVGREARLDDTVPRLIEAATDYRPNLLRPSPR